MPYCGSGSGRIRIFELLDPDLLFFNVVLYEKIKQLITDYIKKRESLINNQG